MLGGLRRGGRIRVGCQIYATIDARLNWTASPLPFGADVTQCAGTRLKPVDEGAVHALITKRETVALGLDARRELVRQVVGQDGLLACWKREFPGSSIRPYSLSGEHRDTASRTRLEIQRFEVFSEDR